MPPSLAFGGEELQKNELTPIKCRSLAFGGEELQKNELTPINNAVGAGSATISGHDR
jgi:hypothetical protein